jgi:hydroxymethylglutaryl-CoA reductase
MDVVEQIRKVKVVNQGGAFQNLPVEDVVIKTVVISDAQAPKGEKAKKSEKDPKNPDKAKLKPEDKTKKK